METWLQSNVDELVGRLSPCPDCVVANTQREVNLPGAKSVVEVLGKLLTVLFPGCHGRRPLSAENGRAEIRRTLQSVALALQDQVCRALEYECRRNQCAECSECPDKARAIVTALLDDLLRIRDILQQDIRAAYEGDPAAKSTMEIVMSYPGLRAVTVHRIAHALYKLGTPLIPRIMGEHAHSSTGIDIHPGASIGPGFFIDHGTGVVIGETCRIGKRVKLYQGVTLGALSFAKDESGALVKGIKRHPDVEDNVVIYAGATILGGDTVIGHDAVIGGNVWLTHSVPPFARVYNRTPLPLIRAGGLLADDYSI